MSTESLKCPNCGASLKTEKSKSLLKCTYCNSTVRLTDSIKGNLIPTLESLQKKITQEIISKIKHLIINGDKIEAIKTYRSHSDVSLKKAKDEVEKIMKEMGLKIEDRSSKNGCMVVFFGILIWLFSIILIPILTGKVLMKMQGESISAKTVESIQALSGILFIVLSFAVFIIWMIMKSRKRGKA